MLMHLPFQTKTTVPIRFTPNNNDETWAMSKRKIGKTPNMPPLLNAKPHFTRNTVVKSYWTKWLETDVLRIELDESARLPGHGSVGSTEDLTWWLIKKITK